LGESLQWRAPRIISGARHGRSQRYGRDNGCCEGNKTGHEPTADAHDAAELPVLFIVPAPDRVGNRTTLPLRTALPGRQQKFDMSGGRCPRSIAATRMASRQAHEGESHRLQFGCPPPLRNASTCVETIHPECQCAVRAARSSKWTGPTNRGGTFAATSAHIPHWEAEATAFRSCW
jgi:hypothetical protein